MAECVGKRPVLVGAEDPPPSQDFWFEGDGYCIYAAVQPRSRWREHTHDCAQVGVGLEARVLVERRTGSRSPERREASGNVVAIVPPGEPHRTLWKRRAILVHIYLGKNFLSIVAGKVLHETHFELLPAHLVAGSVNRGINTCSVSRMRRQTRTFQAIRRFDCHGPVCASGACLQRRRGFNARFSRQPWTSARTPSSRIY